jgi:hypothetical protein
LPPRRLRVQDVDFAANHVLIRTGKGDKDRVTMLPAVLPNPGGPAGVRSLVNRMPEA